MNKDAVRENKGISIIILIIIVMLVLTSLLAFSAAAADKQFSPGDTVVSGLDANWNHYCIDGYELFGESGGILGDGELYQYVLPSTQLAKNDRNILFWATLSFMGNQGVSPELSTIYNNINTCAPSEGLISLKPAVSEADLKKIIHKPSVLKDYPWISVAINNAEQYMKLGGIIGTSSSQTSTGGKSVPAILQNHMTLSDALQIDQSFILQFDNTGADKDFISTVPMKFSSDGSDASWSPVPSGGWSYQKTDTNIIFSNPDPQPPQIFIMFDTDKTEYANSGGFTSVEEAYEQGLQLWVCIACNNAHVTRDKTMPLEAHQRLVYMEIISAAFPYYAAIGSGTGMTSDSGSLQFNIYRHQEDMTATYNVQLNKYDYETGQPLENAVFKLYERFDDKDQIDTERDGPVHIYEGGEPYKSYHTDDPVIWDDFRYAASVSTDENGHAGKTINRGYHYDKTFCDGHPAPAYVHVPDEEYDDEGDLENGSEISAAQAENQKLSKAWMDCHNACVSHASGDFDGVHFHWMMSSVSESKIDSVLSSGGSPGEKPDAGTTASAGGVESYRNSGCERDCEDTYEKFISLRYSYTWVEHTAREGYIRHDNHPDDIPIEVIITDSSENGANAYFSGQYSNDIVVNSRSRSLTAESYTADISEMEPQAQVSSGKRPTGKVMSLTKPIENYVQAIVSFHLASDGAEDENEADRNDVVEIINDLEEVKTATGSNAVRATSSNASPTASASNAAKMGQFTFTATSSDASYQSAFSASAVLRSEGLSQLFSSAYQAALGGTSVGTDITPGDDQQYSHCNNKDGEGDSWEIYDHRTEGEIHINKRDMELEAGDSDEYDSYGEAQGDATVEGAVYGLFAAADINHPDGKSGVVYRANNLVAVAATDKNGDASFLACTEAPGYSYDYETGQIAATNDGWNQNAPKNLYIRNHSIDDYTADSSGQRHYADNAGDNGNCWIGRPLLMGDYYIKELSRSEGYELSIGNRKHADTNQGQDYYVTTPQGSGYANITKNLYAEGQISENATGTYGDPDYNELFFSVESQGTGTDGFDVVLAGLPEGTRLYRLDSENGIRTVQAGTGIYDKVYLTNTDGSPKYVVAETDYQYPKYNADGSFMTTMVPINYQARQIPAAEQHGIDPDKAAAAISEAEHAMTSDEVLGVLTAELSPSDLLFLKGKVEKVLRRNNKYTPKLVIDGTTTYSGISSGIFDEGIRSGDIDESGISGCRPGEAAVKTVFGTPVIVVQLSGKKDNGDPITMADAILSVLDFYNTNGFYNYGGVHSIENDGDNFLITLYAGQYGNPDNFIVPGTNVEEPCVIYHRVDYLPEDPAVCPRYLYVTYSEDDDGRAFGTYNNLVWEQLGGRLYGSAELITDAVIQGDGTIISKTTTENVYYQTGEIPRDASGNRIRAFEFQERTTAVEMEVETYHWTEVAAVQSDDVSIMHVNSTYRDSYGRDHNDDLPQSYFFRAVVPEKMVVLTSADLANMYDPGSWSAGDRMGGAAYCLRVRGADVRACLNYANRNITGDNSYIRSVELVYPGDGFVWQDGAAKPGTNTRLNPVGVQERVIKQQVKIVKTINKESYEGTDSFGNVHDDWYTENYSRLQAENVDNFRFKIYLKSNLEHLYRNEDGTVIWQDRKGNQIDILEANRSFPALSGRIYTMVPHLKTPLFKDSDDAVICHNQLYDVTDGLIHENPNKGYSMVLENYNYEKFFDAIAVANGDCWDDGEPAYTSDKPAGNDANTSEYTKENAKASDRVRQFAITWYLREEAARLDHLAGGEEELDYALERYDEALYYAIMKADNYLKPFFMYDLDEIYAIAWDLEENGGSDRDSTTLSADITGSSYYGISQYLPYGTYVIAEQQPRYQELDDFKNRHYQIDKPKEIILPAVYADYEEIGSVLPEMSPFYYYHADDSTAEMERKYHIRFQEESHVIKAENRFGSYEIFKYGLDIDRISNGLPSVPGTGDYFAVTQSEWKPDKNYYNDLDDRTAGPVSYYLSEGYTGRDGISGIYCFSSISETDGQANRIKSMQGVQTARDGTYAPMLVPYTITAPASPDTEQLECAPGPAGESSGVGYAYAGIQNEFYKVKLRIEKLDTETGENILHDQAIFALYAAKREDDKQGTGQVLFYEEPTVVTGSKEFLEAMGAAGLYPTARGIIGALIGEDTPWFGVVSAGTPVCLEEEQIILQDYEGKKTGRFHAFTTMRDGQMISESGLETEFADQNTGYLELPEALGAGVYVLAEIKPPDGYVRSKPIAIEIYSDQVSYYEHGGRDKRVAAAVYENDRAGEHSAQIYVANTPVRLEITKKKSNEKTVTYRISGRVEGSITELNGKYGLDNLELAYNASGTYLGYGWKKGFAEYLYNRKQQGEDVILFYEHGAFAGYGEITRSLSGQTSGNQYVPGAVLTLYDAIEVKPGQDSEDFAYTGVEVVRDRNSNVTGMYVHSIYAGYKIEFVEKDGVWDYQSIRRPDTDILFYDLGGLTVFTEGGDGNLWSYDQNGSRQKIIAGVTTSIFAKKQNRVVYEIVSKDFSEIKYDPMAKAFTKTGADTVIYHLDQDGNRDAMVHPYTGMAYARDGEAVMVWAVQVITDRYDNVIAREKIKTSRSAAIHADTEQEYITGTYQSELQRFVHQLNPVLDEYGRAEYFRRSPEFYTNSNPVYDRDGDFVYDKYDDRLRSFNANAYMVKEESSIFDKGILWDLDDNRNQPLYMRQGEHYIMENTWVSGEKYPNDPFVTEMTDGQTDSLKRVVPGVYILEELQAPKGYAPALPMGITVRETTKLQSYEMSDDIIRIEIDKIDSPENYRISICDYDNHDPSAVSSRRTEGKGRYSYQRIPGVTLALFPARRVYTADFETYPKGWYLVKKSQQPAEWMTYDEHGSAVRQTAWWTTGEESIWVEGLPAGTYLLEEQEVPAGYIKTTMEVIAASNSSVQSYLVSNDHTKLELYKYQTVDGRKEALPNSNPAQLSLYESARQPENLIETWTTNDCRQYTDLVDLTLYGKSSFVTDDDSYSGFVHDFEAMYEQYGVRMEELHWYYTDPSEKGPGGQPVLKEGWAVLETYEAIETTGCIRQQWKTDQDKVILITIYPNRSLTSDTPYTFEYQFHVNWLDHGVISYDLSDGTHRFDYLAGDDSQPEGKKYILVETKTPDGYLPAEPKEIWVKEIADIQIYSLENKPVPPKDPEEPTTAPPKESTTAPTTEPPEETTPPETTTPETTVPETSPPVPQTTPGSTEPDRPSRPSNETEPTTTVPQTETKRVPGYITARYDGGDYQARGLELWVRQLLAKTGDGSFTWILMVLTAVSGVSLIIWKRRHNEKQAKAGDDRDGKTEEKNT